MAKRVKKEEAELSDVGKLMIKNTKEDDKLKQEILKDLKKNPKYKEYFSTYNKQTVEAFIKNYAEAKWRYLKYGEMYLKKEDEEISRYKNRAERLFWLIQQKKLFNLQCQFRAEKITIPGIELCEDFDYWEKAIKTCPFLDRVSEEEFNMLVEFINSGAYDYDNDYEYCDWQSYQKSFGDDDWKKELPDWYDFFDDKMGTGYLLDLPDIRGEKELKYTRLASKQRMEDYKKEHPEYNPSAKSDPRPMMGYSDDFIVDFIKRFDDPVLLKYHALMDRSDYDDSGYPELSNALEDLKNAEIPIPVAEGGSWQEVIITSMAEHEVRQLNKALPIVFDEYLFRLDNNISFGYSDAELEEQTRTRKMIDDHHRKSVLQGRKLNGEPEDLNF